MNFCLLSPVALRHLKTTNNSCQHAIQGSLFQRQGAVGFLRNDHAPNHHGHPRIAQIGAVLDDPRDSLESPLGLLVFHLWNTTTMTVETLCFALL